MQTHDLSAYMHYLIYIIIIVGYNYISIYLFYGTLHKETQIYIHQRFTSVRPDIDIDLCTPGHLYSCALNVTQLNNE